MRYCPVVLRWLLSAVVVVVLALAGGGCGGERYGDGSLGVVVVEEGQAVWIRVLAPGGFDFATRRGVELGIADYGTVRGFPVQAEVVESGCSPEGGQAAAETAAADPRTAGVVGPSCSKAAVTAAPVLSAAGLTMISPSATAPSLTSDLAGTPGANWRPGFYRTASNDLYQAEALVRFLTDQLGVTGAAVLHTGGAYSHGLYQAFAAAFQRQGGTLAGHAEISEDGSEVAAALTQLAAGKPGALFLPLFPEAAGPIARQARTVPGLEQALLVAADGLLVDQFLELPEAEGLFLSGPAPAELGNTNQSTDKTGAQVLADYERAHGAPPDGPWWAPGYDAAAILLDAIGAASRLKDGALHIDRAGIREYLTGLSKYQGLTGQLGCDTYGDCGSQKIAVIEHLDHQNIPNSRANIVYQTSP